MQTQLKKTLPLFLVITGLILTGVFTYSLSFVFSSPESNPPDSSSLTQTNPTPIPALQDSKLAPVSVTIALSPTPATLPSNNTNTTPQPTPTPIQTSQESSSPTLTTTPTSAPTPGTNVHVTLQIDNEPPFDLEVDSSHNHCQVLETALAQGKLSSLNLKFFSSLSSYGVYQINGLGDTSQVWWTYSVNGQQPPYGCSQIKVNQGDVIHWTYAGPR